MVQITSNLFVTFNKLMLSKNPRKQKSITRYLLITTYHNEVKVIFSYPCKYVKIDATAILNNYQIKVLKTKKFIVKIRIVTIIMK